MGYFDSWNKLDFSVSERLHSLQKSSKYVSEVSSAYLTFIVPLTHLFPMHPFSTPWKLEGFLMFSAGRERMHWKQMFKFKMN